MKIPENEVYNELAKRDFEYFVNQTKEGYHFSSFSKKICSELNKFLEDIQNGKRPILIIQAPPQHGKSELASRRFPAYAFGRNPDFRIACCSYSSDLAVSMNRDVQRIMLEENYQKIFPNSSLNKKRIVTVDYQPLRNSERFDIVGHSGYYVCAGVGGPLTGKSVDIGIIDDPFKNMKEARSEAVKEAVLSWYNTVFLTRLSQNSGQLVMATRWTVDDLIGHLITTQSENKRITILKFPALDENDNPLVPELHSKEKLLETKQMMSSFEWQALYQQEPQIIGGNLFKSHWWQYYITNEVDYDHLFMVGDTAQKTKEHNDFTAITLWGVTKQNQLYLIDLIYGKWEAPELEKRVIAFWDKWKDGIRRVTPRALYIEDKASGTGLIQSIRTKGGIPILAIQRNTDKLTRVLDTLPYIESGNVYLPIGEHIAISQLVLSETSAFCADMSHKHDDITDTICDAVDITFRNAPMRISDD